MIPMFDEAGSVERYRECTSGNRRYHKFKRRAVSGVSEQLILLVEQMED